MPCPKNQISHPLPCCAMGVRFREADMPPANRICTIGEQYI
ncbi:hypothetical protein [Microseira wollei]|nr:hypothetical protein [Microseira wollei]